MSKCRCRCKCKLKVKVRATSRVAEAGGLEQKVLFKGARSLGAERGRDGAGGDFAGAIGHAVGYLKDVGKACARERAAGVGVVLLLGYGAVRVEADGVVLVVGGAGNGNGPVLKRGPVV
jgi:hypothetical protein